MWQITESRLASLHFPGTNRDIFDQLFFGWLPESCDGRSGVCMGCCDVPSLLRNLEGYSGEEERDQVSMVKGEGIIWRIYLLFDPCIGEHGFGQPRFYLTFEF